MKEFYERGEISELLNLSDAVVDSLIRKGILKSTTVKFKKRFSLIDILKIIPCSISEFKGRINGRQFATLLGLSEDQFKYRIQTEEVDHLIFSGRKIFTPEIVEATFVKQNIK